MTSRDGGEESVLDRRTLMRMVGVSAVATGLAGCQDATQQSYEFTADPVEYAGDPAEAGYTEESQETVTSKRTESVGGVDAEVTVNSQVAIYSSERDTEPMDVGALWSDSGAVLADWTGGEPMPGVRASEVVEGETLTLQSGDGETSIPAAAAQVWAPNTKFGDLTREDLLVAYALPEDENKDYPIPHWTPDGSDREAYGFQGEVFFPPRMALDGRNKIYVGGSFDT